MSMHADGTQQKNVYVVLGMARSGTSAIARGLKALGVDLGEQLTPGDKAWNPKGFFEDTDIVYKINRGVLYALDYSWTSLNTLDAQCINNSALVDIKNYAVELLQKRMSTTNYWGFKDPRTAKLLPFWQDIFKTLNLNDQYVIALRNPLASAYSYQKVSGTEIEEGLLLWLMHLILAIDGTHSKKRIVVSYDFMLQDPRAQLLRIHRDLNIPMPMDEKEVEEYTNKFLDKNLHHYEYSYENLKAHAATSIVPLCLHVYTTLVKLAKDEVRFDSEEFYTAWRAIKDEFDEIYPVYCYIDTLLQKNKSLVRANRSLHRSIPWKLIYPLRIVDNFLRQYRKRARVKKRLNRSYG